MIPNTFHAASDPNPCGGSGQAPCGEHIRKQWKGGGWGKRNPGCQSKQLGETSGAYDSSAPFLVRIPPHPPQPRSHGPSTNTISLTNNGFLADCQNSLAPALGSQEQAPAPVLQQGNTGDAFPRVLTQNGLRLRQTPSPTPVGAVHGLAAHRSMYLQGAPSPHWVLEMECKSDTGRESTDCHPGVKRPQAPLGDPEH